MYQKDTHQKLYVSCECGTLEHLFKFTYWLDDEFPDDVLYMQVHLANSDRWYQRIWAGLRHMFGYRSKYGEFDEVLINQTKAMEMRDFLSAYIENEYPEQT